jgi:hypothetical protein
VIECNRDVKGFDDGDELLLFIVVVGEAIDIFI